MRSRFRVSGFYPTRSKQSRPNLEAIGEQGLNARWPLAILNWEKREFTIYRKEEADLAGEHYPVAVVGAGPTGLTTANLLGGAGIPTLVVERHDSTVSEPRAVSIDDEALRTLQSVGLSKPILADSMLDYGLHYLTAKGKCFARVEPDLREFGYPRRNAFRQPVLEATLRDGLERFEHLTVCFRHTLEAVSQDSDLVRLSIRRPDGAIQEVTCAWLAACDGGRSFVRHALGIAMAGSSFEQRWLIIDLLGTRDRFRQTRVFCNPSRPGITLPGPGGTRRYEFLLHDGEDSDNAESEAYARELLRQHGPDGQMAIIRQQVYTFQARQAERWREGRIFLLGDAAHLTPPFAGQGMNSGIRDAHNFAWKVGHVIRGALPESVLESYQEERKPHSWALIEFAMLIGKVMVPASRFQAWLQQTAFRLLPLFPPAYRYVTQMRFKPKPFYEGGFLIARRDAPGAELVGRMLPQPLIETAQGEVVLLDQILGNNFALLAFAADAQQILQEAKVDLKPSAAVQLVAVLPRTWIPEDGDGLQVVRDLEGAIGRFLGARQVVLLLIRPDRYVAAALTSQDIQNNLSQLGSLLPKEPRRP